jgi:general secretion pathway protein L
MANALEQKIQQLSHRVRTGPVGKFFSWWMEELRLALPESVQERLQHAARRVTLQPVGDQLVLAVDENRRLRALGDYARSQDASLQRQEIEDRLDDEDLVEAPRFLLLDAATALTKDLSLPQAAEANLEQVLSFEMDRQTPFKASAVYFDWIVTGRDAPGGKVHRKLFVATRNEVDGWVRELNGRGYHLAGIDIRDGDRTLGLNLMPAEQRFRIVNRKARVNLALAGAAVILLAIVMAQSLSLREHQVEQLEEAIAGVQGEARAVARIRQEIDDASEAAGFLATRRAETPLAIELLADITSFLPDDTYLDRLVLNKSSVQIQGKSSNAQRLIELVNESDYLEGASFRGSTRLDARSGLEIFEINASVTPVEEG